MSQLFSTAAQFITDGLSAAGATESVTLTSAEAEPEHVLAINAAPGGTDWEETESDGTVTRIRSRDWIIDAAELVDGPETIRPARGWIITDAAGNRYECYSPGADAPWSYSDTEQKRVRIHTRSLDQRNG